MNTELMNEISQSIRLAEAKMHRIYFKPATFGTLTWAHGPNRMQIFLGDRSLISCKFEDRFKNFTVIPCLIEAAKQATDEFLRTVSREEIDAVNAAILDIPDPRKPEGVIVANDDSIS